MFTAIVVLFVAFILIIAGIAGAFTSKGSNQKPTPKDPIDQYMDDNYADIDWLRNGKL